MIRCWLHVYLSPADILRVNKGSQFRYNDFWKVSDAFGIQVVQEPTEHPAAMSHVERYHGPLLVAFNKISQDIPNAKLSEIIQMAVHCVSNTVGPE